MKFSMQEPKKHILDHRSRCHHAHDVSLNRYKLYRTQVKDISTCYNVVSFWHQVSLQYPKD